MEREPSPEMDDELFNDIYGKAYTGPVVPSANSVAPGGSGAGNKRPSVGPTGQSDDEADGLNDPNAVPTDFTSREARVWEAKAKATERNWKKRKEEEMICKLCGDPGHFTQGCPSTLGANRKTSEIFERVAARDKQVRDLFPPKVISQIERDVGCKITMNEKFLIVTAKDRLILSKGVDSVHKIIQEGREKEKEKEKQGANSPNPNPYPNRNPNPNPRGSARAQSRSRSRSRSPPRRSADVSPRDLQFRRSGSQRSFSPRNSNSSSRSQSRGFHPERSREDRFSRRSPQARDYPKYGGAARRRSKSPKRPYARPDTYRSHEGQNRNFAHNKVSGWDVGGGRESRVVQSRPETKFEYNNNNNSNTDNYDHNGKNKNYPETLEELEMEFKREAVELARARDQEEDQENYMHREKIREISESYMRNLATTRNTNSNQWDAFLQQSFPQAPRQLSQHSAYVGTGITPDPRNSYPYSGENNSTSNSAAPTYGSAYGRY